MTNWETTPFVGDTWKVRVKGGKIVSELYIYGISRKYVCVKDTSDHMFYRQHPLENIEFIERIMGVK